MGNFDHIMIFLNPKELIATVEIPNDNARASFMQHSSIVNSHSEFQQVLIAYISHHMTQVFHSAPPPEFCLSKARNYLESSGGYDNAVFLALSGSGGGMNAVLNLLNDGFKQEAKQAYFAYVVDNYVDPLNFDETVELMKDLKQKLGGYSPAAFGYIQPEAMAANFKAIIWSYIDSLTKYKNLWSY